jgi:hypothetical protein
LSKDERILGSKTHEHIALLEQWTSHSTFQFVFVYAVV